MLGTRRRKEGRLFREIEDASRENAERRSRDTERRVSSTVAELAATPERLELNSPAVLIFGEVAGLTASGLVEDVLSLPELSRAYA